MRGQFIARGKTQIWIPDSYKASRKWPAILFLLGSGERGSDGIKQTTVGLGHALTSGKIDPQAIIIFPQCPANHRWVSDPQIAIAALEAAEREFSIDKHRVALPGMSMGGAGAWLLAAKYPRIWSALAPVCGYVHHPPKLPELGDASKSSFEVFARKLPRIPIWIFHGSDDATVPVEESREMARALGPRAGYTEFARTGHNAWDPAYTETHLVQWLIQQRR